MALNLLRLGVVLTLPATGTEMNSNSVISRAETKEKLAFASPFCYPVFSIMDISLLPSLPKRQRINGVIDAFVHTTEQYMTFSVNAKMQDRIAEGIFSTLIEEGKAYIDEPDNKEAATNVLYTAMMALNGWLSTGVPTDWSIHMVGHELTALIGVDHGISLAIILPSMYRRLVESKKEKLAQYARRVWGVDEINDMKAALKGIDLTEKFFNDLGAVTRLSHYTDDKKYLQDEICRRFESRKWLKFGEKGEVTMEVVREVIEMAW
jgi:NADP-dependent alcohol dehydrogenase